MRDYEPKWSLICAATTDSTNEEDKPGMRGGHQMCIDSDTGKETQRDRRVRYRLTIVYQLYCRYCGKYVFKLRDIQISIQNV